jgi:hypothetical protein
VEPSLVSDCFIGCPNQEIGQMIIFKGHKIGTSSYFGADSATKKTMSLVYLTTSLEEEPGDPVLILIF